MSNMRIVAWIDAVFSCVFVLLVVLLIYLANQAAADAIRRYGHNVDSGALAYFVAIVYLAPVAVLFAFASCALFLGWVIRWYVHWFAVLCAVAPIIFDISHGFSA